MQVEEVWRPPYMGNFHAYLVHTGRGNALTAKQKQMAQAYFGAPAQKQRSALMQQFPASRERTKLLALLAEFLLQ